MHRGSAHNRKTGRGHLTRCHMNRLGKKAAGKTQESSRSLHQHQKGDFLSLRPKQKRCALEDESQMWPTSHTPASHCSCTHLGARVDWGGHPALVTAGTHREGRWVRHAGLGSSRPVIAGGWSAGTVQDVIHTVTASQREGPEQEEKTLRWEPKSKDQGAAQVLAQHGMSLEVLAQLQEPLR